MTRSDESLPGHGAGRTTSEPAPAITGIVIPVPEARAYAAHPHITLLAPFRARDRLDEHPLRASLRAFFARVAPLSFALVEERRFPVGIDYLALEPEEPFRAMTFALAAEFPDTPPYGGQFPDVIPHLTIDIGTRPVPLPIAAHAAIAHLVHSHDDKWDVVAQFPLAG